MWRMPPPTNASYVGRFAPPGSPKTTSTPSAFRHSITASTARTSSTSFRTSEEKPVYQRVFAPLGRAEANADREADAPADRDEQQRGTHRDAKEAVPDPRDREQLDRHHHPGHDQCLVDVRDDERERVKDAPEHGHPARDRPAHDRRAATGFFTRVRPGLRPAHAHARAKRDPEPDDQGRV